jgi:hypothetical protein
MYTSSVQTGRLVASDVTGVQRRTWRWVSSIGRWAFGDSSDDRLRCVLCGPVCIQTGKMAIGRVRWVSIGLWPASSDNLTASLLCSVQQAQLYTPDASDGMHRRVRWPWLRLFWRYQLGELRGSININPNPPFEVSCSFVQLKNTFQVQGSARALVRIVIWESKIKDPH